jgi:hypothetical protein
MSNVIGDSMTRLVKLERSASRRRNSSSPSLDSSSRCAAGSFGVRSPGVTGGWHSAVSAVPGHAPVVVAGPVFRGNGRRGVRPGAARLTDGAGWGA